MRLKLNKRAKKKKKKEINVGVKEMNVLSEMH